MYFKHRKRLKSEVEGEEKEEAKEEEEEEATEEEEAIEEEEEEAMATEDDPSLNNDTSNFISIGAAIQAVQALPDIDEDLLFEAIGFLEKGKNAAIFIAMNAKLRSKWLRKKLRPKPMEILVKTQYGKTITLENVFMFTTIKELKAKLQSKQAYLPTKIQLIYGGMQLEARRRISDYGIKDRSVIHVV